MESGFALFVALLINIAVVSVSGTVCTADNLSSDDSDRCSDLTLNSASFLLKVCPFKLKTVLVLCHQSEIEKSTHVEMLFHEHSSKSMFTSECFGEVKLNSVWDCIAGLWTKLHNNRNICWPVHHAGKHHGTNLNTNMISFFLVF